MKDVFIKYHLRKALEENKPLTFLQKIAVEEAAKKVEKDLRKDKTS